MAYTSKAQIIDRWGTDEVVRSADRDPEDGVVDDAAVTAACADASSLIDSYLERGGHKTPVDPVPDVLVNVPLGPDSHRASMNVPAVVLAGNALVNWVRDNCTPPVMSVMSSVATE